MITEYIHEMLQEILELLFKLLDHKAEEKLVQTNLIEFFKEKLGYVVNKKITTIQKFQSVFYQSRESGRRLYVYKPVGHTRLRIRR